MRTIRIMQALYLIGLLILDTFINAVVGQFTGGTIVFVSNLHFLGLLYLIQNDTVEQSLIKAGVVGLFLDMTHYNTLPIFFSVYLLSMGVARIIKRYLGFSFFEMLVLTIISIYAKEMLTYIFVVLGLGLHQSLMGFVSQRVIWVVLGNLLLLPIASAGYQKMHAMILKRAENMYIR